MKRIFTNLIAGIFCVTLFAQAPQGMKYQTVVRDNSGNVIANQTVGVKLSILKGGSTGTAVYVETHSVSTNGFGLANMNIGGGTVQSGTFSGIAWGTDSYFVKVEMDVTGGTAYTHFGTSQLLSVPYALHAKTVENSDDADADATNEIQTISKSGNTITLSNGGGSVTDDVNDPDSDATNEIQTLSISGTQLSLSNGGGTVNLPATGGGDNWGTQVAQTDATLSGNGTPTTPLKIAQQGAAAGQNLQWNGTSWLPGTNDDNDADPANEIQTVSVSNDTLSISGGNSVKLPGDNWGAQVAQTDATLTGDGSAVLPLGIAQQAATLGQLLGWNGTTWSPVNEAQTLSIAGNNLSVSGGNTVALPSSVWGINGSNIFYNLGNVGIGFNNPSTFLHIRDLTGMLAPQLQIDNTFPGMQGNASIGFASFNSGVNFSMGLDNTSVDFLISSAPQLQPAVQNDKVTIMRAIPPGITSFNNQSRARVFQAFGTIPTQLIPFAVWQPIDYDMASYDTHGEWLPAPIGSSGSQGGPATSFFTALEEGYYQVNARTDFMFLEDYNPMMLNPNGHVCIAIYVGRGGMQSTVHSKGNKLQGTIFFFNAQQQEVNLTLPNNMAPNVSDVIYLMPGDVVEIRVWQDVYHSLGLVPGTSETYVSIHKIS